MLAKPDLLMRVRLIKFTPLFWSDNVMQFLWVTCYHVKEVSCTYEQAFKVTEQTVEVFPCSYNCPTVWLLLWPGLSCKRDSKSQWEFLVKGKKSKTKNIYIDICSDTEDETYCSLLYCIFTLPALLWVRWAWRIKHGYLITFKAVVRSKLTISWKLTPSGHQIYRWVCLVIGKDVEKSVTSLAH